METVNNFQNKICVRERERERERVRGGRGSGRGGMRVERLRQW